MAEPEAFTWDYREQPPMESIAAAVLRMSGGRVRIYLPPTETDEYAAVVSDRILLADEVERAWLGDG